MGPIAFAFRGRFARRRRSWIGLGLLLGIGFGIAFSTLAAARHTASAYRRIVEHAEAPDATSGYTQPTDEVESQLAGIDGVESLRSLVGFTGFVEGVDPSYNRVLFGPWGNYFPVELPKLRDGRLPDAMKREEVFVNEYFADHAGVAVGDQIRVSLYLIDADDYHTETMTVTGIGKIPRELVADETSGFGLIVLSSTVVRELNSGAAYRSTGFSLAPGIDPQNDLYPQLRDRGLELNETLAQDIDRVQTAERPLLALLTTFGLVVLIGSAIGTFQVVTRGTVAWRADDRTLQVLGLSPRQVIAVRVAGAMVTALTAALTAVVVMIVASPVAPVGPLHASDPVVGIHLDLAVLAAGIATILVIATATSVLANIRSPTTGTRPRGRPRPVTMFNSRPTAMAGLSFANPSGGQSPGRKWSSIAFAVAAVALTAGVVAVGSSARALVNEPKRYGFDWDLVVLNAFDDQRPEALRSILGDDPDVAAATGFTANIYAINSDFVAPGFAITEVKGTLQPTLIAGREVRAANEVVLGRETLRSIGADIGDQITIEELTLSGASSAAATVRIVGTVTFPPVSQTGNDQPRLGDGILLTAEARQTLGVDPNDPEWTAIRLADGVRPDAFIAAHPDGIPSRGGAPTEWFDSAAPAEIRELRVVLGVFVGAATVSFAIALAIVLYALLAQVRSSRRDMAVLRAIGFTRGQLSSVVAWQSLPLTLASSVIGIPIGIWVGRQQYAGFARRLGVIEGASTPPLLMLGLVLGVLLALGLSVGVAMIMVRRTQPSIILRSP
ncbi:MAG: ABC transporter permease [Acidimicrobiales bacterium]